MTIAAQSDSQLTDAQRQQAMEWLNSKTSLLGKCPLCGDRGWAILADFLKVTSFSASSLTGFGDVAYPCFGVICNNCGNTHFVNAIKAGLLGADPGV